MNNIVTDDIVRKVQQLYSKYIPKAARVSLEQSNHPEGWSIHTDEFGDLVFIRKDIEKQAEDGILPKVGKGWIGAQKLIGGPNPLTALLLSGALGTGVGYGAGKLLNWALPGYVTKDAPWRFGLLGGLGTAGISGLLNTYPALKRRGLKGMIQATPFQGGEPFEIPEEEASTGGIKTSSLEEHIEKLAQGMGVNRAPNVFQQVVTSAGSRLPQLPTDDWGRVIEDDRFLSPKEKAVAAGVPAAAGVARKSKLVSPADVATVAVNAGLGFGYGSLGSIGARFLGLSPKVQKGIQNAGLLAGAVRGITGIMPR